MARQDPSLSVWSILHLTRHQGRSTANGKRTAHGQGAIHVVEGPITIEKIHNEFIPKYDRWQGKLLPRIEAWFAHLFEIASLWLKGSKPYCKHGRTLGTCRQHARTEFGDWLWLTAEIIWMVTNIELPIVPKATFKRVLAKMQEVIESRQ